MAIPPLTVLVRCRAALLASVALLGGCADDELGGRCTLREVAVLRVLNDTDVPLIAGTLDGSPVAFMVDTGAGVSTISAGLSKTLHLSTDASRVFRVPAVGGVAIAPSVVVHDLAVGELHAKDVRLAMTAGKTFEAIAGRPIAGSFAADFLSNFDVDFDLAAHRIGLDVEDDCGRNFSPWAGTVDVANVRLAPTMQIVARFEIDDHPGFAIFDTGSSRTSIGTGLAEDLGIPVAAMKADRPYIIIGLNGFQGGRLHQFRSLEFGGEQEAPVLAVIANIPNVIGADWLRTHRVLVSYRHREILMQPNVPSAGHG